MRKLIILSMYIFLLLILVGCKSSNTFIEGDFRFYKTDLISSVFPMMPKRKHTLWPKTARLTDCDWQKFIVQYKQWDNQK